MTLRLIFTMLLVISSIKLGLAGDAKFGFERPPATNTQQPLPAVSIIIDDLGEQRVLGERAIALPGEITYAFLPHTSHAVHLAELAHQHNREVMIHIPMQPVGDSSLGKGGLTLDMSQQNFIATLKDNLSAIPHISGINNHMGSLLTQHPEKMAWLMQTLSEEHNGLFFVDSRTTEHTVAYAIAAEFEIPRINRNVFLDNIRTEKEIGIQFKRLLILAKRHGTAVAIGHPYPETFKFLEQMLPTLQQQGIELIKISSLIQRKHRLETTTSDTMLAAKERHNQIGLPHTAESRAASLIQ